MPRRLRHVVLFQLRPGLDEASARRLVAELQALAIVPGVLDLAVGYDISDRSDYDVALSCDFAHASDLRGYLADPRHQRVVTEVLPATVADRVVVDFWVTSAASTRRSVVSLGRGSRGRPSRGRGG